MFYPLPSGMPWREKAAILVRRGEASDFYAAAAMLSRHGHRDRARGGAAIACRVFSPARPPEQIRLPYADN